MKISIIKPGFSWWLIPGFCIYLFLFQHLNSYFLYNLKQPPVVTDNYYKGILIEELAEYQQQDTATCGHAALAYLLSLYNIKSTEIDIILNTKKTEWLSFKDMADYVSLKKMRYQALEVSPFWFRRHPVPCVMHVHWGHFITFIDFNIKGECLIFDPTRGLILLKWQTLKKIWDGNLIYVYQ